MTGTAQVTSPARIRLLLTVLVTAVVVSVMNNSMVAVLLAAVREDFTASAAGVGWVVSGFSLTFALGTACYGRVSDVFGLRGVFAVGLAVFAAGSVLAAAAPALGVLVAARAVQGIGAAAVPALSAVAVARVLPPGRRGFAFGLLGTGLGVGQALGPVLGGFAAEIGGWRAPFLGTSLLVAPVLIGALRTLPGRDAERSSTWRELDVLGGTLLGAAAALLLVGVTQVQAMGIGHVSAWGSALAAVLLAGAFAVRIRRAATPFVPPALFTNRPFLVASGVGFLALFGYLAAIILVSQALALAGDLGAGVVGLLLTPGAVAVATLSAAAGRTSDRLGARPLVLGGLALLVGVTVLLSTVVGATVGLIAVAMFGMGAGFALIISPAQNAAANALSGDATGAGLGLYQGVIFLGAGSGVAVVSAVVTARAAASPAWNPLHAGAAGAFSDGFLLIAAVFAVAVPLAAALPRGAPARAP